MTAGPPAAPHAGISARTQGSLIQCRACRYRGLQVNQDVHSFIDDAWPRNPLEERRVRYWRAAGRTTLFMLLGFSGLQYYFFDVYLTIMAMPKVTLLAALP